MLQGSQQETERADETMYEIYYPELAATFSGNLLADTLLYPLETVLYRLYLQVCRSFALLALSRPTSESRTTGFT